ncbi:Decorin [Bagarius yarrelli]|uniref:Decorin n=1 Tax=Bagarius yarrelli TaxID=175774 RepID=A0A556V3D8_BAGYA|nr:Decorin [Bagarius yarrelli]
MISITPFSNLCPVFSNLQVSNSMRLACLTLLLVSVCWALPFRQSGFLDFMMEDEPNSGDGPSVVVPKEDARPEFPVGPVCPFRCQCHLRVVQCSDLGMKNVPEEIPSDTHLHFANNVSYCGKQQDLLNQEQKEIPSNIPKSVQELRIHENQISKIKKALILVNNKITIIHAKAFTPLVNLQRLYLSKNMLKEIPSNIPKSVQELRIHENQISKIKKVSFTGMVNVIVMELGSNPLTSSGVDADAFKDLKRVSYIRIADTNITSIPKGLPTSLSELHLDGNKITKVTADSLKGLKHLAKLGLSNNEISVVENGTLVMMPHLRELHLDHNALTSIPAGLPDHKYIQVIYLHANKIASVGTEDFCPPSFNTKKAMYSGISLFSNPVLYWEIQPITFRCVFDRSAVQLGNYRKK